jgi:AraC-like DNA-binding protein
MQLFRVATAETAIHREGGETVLAKLAELLFVDALRSHIDALPEEATGWLSGLRETHIGAALALLHGRPFQHWTVEKLAREVGLSRSIFAERFSHFMHDTPMHYLARWRMQLAKQHLERHDTSIAQVAAEVGYDSEAAFNRAFKKCMGLPPGLWRRTHPKELSPR